jgi:hypothetical protein
MRQRKKIAIAYVAAVPVVRAVVLAQHAGLVRVTQSGEESFLFWLAFMQPYIDRFGR